MNIEQTIQQHQISLSKEVFRFWVNDDLELRLDSYDLFERLTTRHQFKSVLSYKRLFKRDSNIEFSDIYIPSVIIERAKQEIFQKINFISNK